MGRKEKVSKEEKLFAIEDYLAGRRGRTQICLDLQIHHRSFEVWLQKYKLHGTEGLVTVSRNKIYPETVKLLAVRDYLSGEYSLDQLCFRYEISAHSILQNWIKKYNGHETFKSHNAQGDRFMTKGRKTTYEERVEIVAFCVANNDNYQLTSEKFLVSYQQIYTWVQKYRLNGYEALSDKRGKRIPFEELTETKKVAAQLKLLEAENSRLKMENDFLKKLDEVERRRELVKHIKNTNI